MSEVVADIKVADSGNPKGESCGTCPFIEVMGAQSGRCHRFPPSVAGDEYAFPWVDLKTGWCGEHPALRQ